MVESIRQQIGCALALLLVLDAGCASAAASRAPEIRASTWLNVPAGAAPDLRGKTLLVEFWTFG